MSRAGIDIIIMYLAFCLWAMASPAFGIRSFILGDRIPVLLVFDRLNG